ncbi:hypothetical protein RJ639_013321 [Escallonia herrerae]|uniref:Anamorsin C-terminal domain-containing protein n=1 Tax=Escallonia herrerae TaxID=1293975 RepID=A0AA89APN3_9ASTE|nr:hypothetical protein RJ639_013321 [Escallonia herrerae]
MTKLCVAAIFSMHFRIVFTTSTNHLIRLKKFGRRWSTDIKFKKKNEKPDKGSVTVAVQRSSQCFCLFEEVLLPVVPMIFYYEPRISALGVTIETKKGAGTSSTTISTTETPYLHICWPTPTSPSFDSHEQINITGSLPVKSSATDIVISISRTLDFPGEELFKEFSRVLKPGGEIVLHQTLQSAAEKVATSSIDRKLWMADFEEIQEVQIAPLVQVADCYGCGLGLAFLCRTCPYMDPETVPFKLGEKEALSTSFLLASDTYKKFRKEDQWIQ